MSTHLKTMGMVELSPSLREGREVTSGEGRRQASDDSKRTMTKKSPIPFTTNRARSLLAERLQTNWVFRMSSRNVKRQELVCEVSRQRKSNTGLAAALPSLSLDPPGGRVNHRAWTDVPGYRITSLRDSANFFRIFFGTPSRDIA